MDLINKVGVERILAQPEPPESPYPGNAPIHRNWVALIKAIVATHYQHPEGTFEHNDDLSGALEVVYTFDCPLATVHEHGQFYCGCECGLCCGLSGCEADRYQCEHWVGHEEVAQRNILVREAITAMDAAMRRRD